MTTEDAYRYGLQLGWSTALAKMLWEIRRGRDVEEVYRELAKQAPVDGWFPLREVAS